MHFTMGKYQLVLCLYMHIPIGNGLYLNPHYFHSFNKQRKISVKREITLLGD
jgi:hypothetical protein